MATYTVQILRTGVNEGKLKYTGSFTHSCKCWWDPQDRIAAGTYSHGSATTMSTKTNSRGGAREGIYIPSVPKRFGIFVHYWPGPGAKLEVWSDGCTLILEADMLKIWNDIKPKDGQNVTVTVRDQVTGG